MIQEDDVRSFVCDLCEKENHHQGPSVPTGWGTVSLIVSRGYDRPVKLKGDVCDSCVDRLSSGAADIWKGLKQVKGEKKK